MQEAEGDSRGEEEAGQAGDSAPEGDHAGEGAGHPVFPQGKYRLFRSRTSGHSLPVRLFL